MTWKMLKTGIAALILIGGAGAARSDVVAPPAPHKPPPRAPFTRADRTAAEIPGFPSIRFFGDDPAAFRKALPAKTGSWLVLSAGGEDGAFGAGFVARLDSSGKRPAYSVITGVSTGALIATYAFAGQKYDQDLKSAYTTITSADVFEVGQTPESLVDAWPFRKLIARRITPALLADVAAQYAHGRRLFVVTTDLDAGRPVVWNMGAIAAHKGARALALFRQVLLASSSIPGMFQPVTIKSVVNGRTISELYSDGGVSAPFYVAPEAVLTAATGGAGMASSIQVVVNAKLTPDFAMTKRNTLSILGRALGLGLKAGARAEIADVRRWAAHNDIAVSFVSLNASFHAQSHGAFDPNYMKALFAQGEKEARNGSASLRTSLGVTHSREPGLTR